MSEDPTAVSVGERVVDGRARDQHVWNVFDVHTTITDEVQTELLIDGGLVAGGGLAAPGLVALVTDSTLGTLAAHLDARMFATAAMTIDFTAQPRESGMLRGRATGRCSRPPGFMATDGVVEDEDGHTLARASAWWALRGNRRDPLPLPTRAPAGLRRTPRPLAGVASSDHAWADPCATPLGETLAISGFTRSERQEVRLDLPVVGQLRNSGGTLHGGVGALLASLAALATLGPEPPRRWDVLSMTTHFLRGIDADAGPVHASGRIVRRGRSLAVVTGDVTDSQGRTGLTTTLTTALGD